ncbi:MAG: hypothetical protein JSS27_10715 [Planctomycetes bacterium]|nr:hypothetical protein [Planctomycetota bacterium]
MFDQVEALKRQYTDKYVVVDDSRPELKRFHGMTGQVKTVNMSGRALVQFDANLNIGWYDIDPDWLRVVDAPPPKPAEKDHKAEKKPAAEKPKGDAPAAEAKKPSVAEMARAQVAAKAAAPAPKPAPAAKPAAPAAKKSTADVLAAARGGAAAPAAKPAAPKPAAKPAAPPPEPEAPAEAEAPPTAAPAKAGGKFNRDALPKAVPDILAWCREHDSKG